MDTFVESSRFFNRLFSNKIEEWYIYNTYFTFSYDLFWLINVLNVKYKIPIVKHLNAVPIILIDPS